MKIVSKYYNKIEKITNKLIKKMFGCKSISDAFIMQRELRIKIEEIIKKPIDEITNEDFIKNGFLAYNYAKYRTISKILQIISEVVVLDKFVVDDYEKEI